MPPIFGQSDHHAAQPRLRAQQLAASARRTSHALGPRQRRRGGLRRCSWARVQPTRSAACTLLRAFVHALQRSPEMTHLCSPKMDQARITSSGGVRGGETRSQSPCGAPVRRRQGPKGSARSEGQGRRRRPSGAGRRARSDRRALALAGTETAPWSPGSLVARRKMDHFLKGGARALGDFGGSGPDLADGDTNGALRNSGN